MCNVTAGSITRPTMGVLGPRGIIIVSILMAVCAAAERTSLMFQVEPKTEDCIYETFKEGESIEAMLVVNRGGKLDIRFRVENPKGSVLYEQLLFSNIDDRTGQVLSTVVRKGYSFKVTSGGEHKFCFDNRMSRWTAKVVDFDLDVSLPDGGNTAGKPLELSSMEERVKRIGEHISTIQDAQKYHYTRERAHRDTAESNNGRVTWWSVVEALVVIAGALGQLFVVHSWFNKETRLPTSV